MKHLNHFTTQCAAFTRFVYMTCLLSFLLCPSSASAQIPSYVPTSGLVGWWPFNGNGNDISGNGNNLNVTGGVQFANDRFLNPSSSIYLTGQNQYLNKFNPNLPSGNVNRSVSVWYKNVTQTDGPTVFAQWDGVYSGTCLTSFSLFADKTGGYFHGRCEDKAWSFPTDNQWINLVLVYESNYIKMYKNGQLINNAMSPDYYNMGNNLNTSTYEFRVGHPGASYTWPSQFFGYIDDIGYWNRALTQQEITNLYSSSVPPSITTTASPSLINCGETSTLTSSSTSAAQPCVKADLPATLQNGLVGYWPFCGNANDASGNNNNGTVNGATLTTDRFENAGSAYTFDGVNDFIFIPPNASFNSSSLSVSFWINIPSIIPSGVQFLVSGNSSNAAWSILYNVQEYGLIKNQGCGTSIVYSMGLAPIVNIWEQITFVFNSSSTLIYKNGALISSQSGSALSGTCGNTGLNIGFDVLGAPEYFLGKLDDICIYNRALSASEIQQLYNLGNVTYSWSTGATTPSITVTPTQTSTYTCTATNAAGSTTSSVTVNVADTLTWTGLYDTDWHKPCNWSPQFVPKCCNNVSVPLTTNQPIVSGVAAAEDLTIYTTNGAQVTVNNGANLQIATCPTAITTATCPSLAVITTTAVSGITQTTAVSGGTITYQGASAITARGVCWGTSPNPTIANSLTSNGTGIGTFTSNLTGLVAGTTYYVRAYATNGSGTSYGNEVSFLAVNPQPGYPANSVFCASGPTLVIDVVNPTTGKTWMDRNLGATQAATSSTDAAAYGDLYQWGRGNDGHQCRNSATTTTLSATDQPGNGNFILAPNSPFDWRDPQNGNFWIGENGVNTPCPLGYRVPTLSELEEERTSWSTNNAAGAFGSPLKLTKSGRRQGTSGSLTSVNSSGYYWPSTIIGAGSTSWFFYIGSIDAYSNAIMTYGRSWGHTVRCIKN